MRDLFARDARLGGDEIDVRVQTLPGRVPPLPRGSLGRLGRGPDLGRELLDSPVSEQRREEIQQHVGLGEALGYALSPRLEVGMSEEESVESAADSERPAAMKASTRNGR